MRLTLGKYPYFVFVSPFENEKTMKLCSKKSTYRLVANKLGQYEDIDESPEHLAKIKKALEIIKEKKVNVAQFIRWFSNEYSRVINYDLYLQDRYQEGWFLHLFDNEQSNYMLIEEEFDLLKEVLL